MEELIQPYYEVEQAQSVNTIFMAFVGFFVFAIVAAAIMIVGHDIAAIFTIQQANAQLEKQVQQLNSGTGVVGFVDLMRSAHAFAAQTWIPGLGDAVRGAAGSSTWTGVTCMRASDPFGYLMGRGDTLSFSDLDDAEGDAFTCYDSAYAPAGTTATSTDSTTP